MTESTVAVGALDAEITPGWDELVRGSGCPFQSTHFLRTFEATWPGSFVPRHVCVTRGNRVVAAIPAYLHGSCPRIDYYRSAVLDHVMDEQLLVSHALVGWYGYPIAFDEADMGTSLDGFVETAAYERAVAVILGVDGRDTARQEYLARKGFYLFRFHTLMSQELTGGAERGGPVSLLPARRAGRWRRRLEKSKAAGTRVRRANPTDTPAILRMIAGVLQRQGTAPTVLPEGFLSQMLSTPPEGFETLVAVTSEDLPIGVKLTFRCRSTYMIWLGGNDRDYLDRHEQSRLLYHSCLSRAVEQGCTEIQAGRSPYPIKLELGYSPVPLLAGVFASEPALHRRAVAWANALAERHLRIYPEVRTT